MQIGTIISENPKTISEKLKWLTIYDDKNYLKPLCADKIKVHDYVKSKLGTDICVPIIKIYDSPNDIRLDELPDKFVLKTNNGYAQNTVCTDKSKLNQSELINKYKKYLSYKCKHGVRQFEPHYWYIEPKCFVEQYLHNDESTELIDYKFLCFNGNPKYMQLIQDRHHEGQRLQYYDMNKKFVNICHPDFINRPDKVKYDVLPKEFDLMKDYAKKLSSEFRFVRVDFYEVNNKVYLGEMTFTPNANSYVYKDPNEAIRMGNLLDLS